MARRDRFRPASYARGAILAPLIAAAALVLVWQRRPVALTDAPDCPGILDLALAVILRASPHLAAGDLLAWTNGIMALAAFALFVRLMQAAARSIAAAVATAFAVLATTAFDRSLAAATPVAVLAATSCAWLEMRRDDEEGSPHALRITALLATMTVALLVPRLLLPTGLLIVWMMCSNAQRPIRTRLLLTAAAAGGVAVASLAITAATPGVGGSIMSSWLRCIVPGAWSPGTLAALGGEGLSIADIGPLPFGLALLGAYSRLDRSRLHGSRWMLALAAAPVVAGGWRQNEPAAVVPLWAGFWCLVAIGLSEVMAERTRARTIVGIAVMVLLPLLQFQRLSLRGAAGASSSYGHGALSTDTLRRILRALPDATLVAEDASLELLVRAASPRLRAGGQDVRVVPRRAAAVSAALAAGRIFAFPRAQLALQHQGVELSGRAMGIPGVAEVQRVVDCARVGRQWSDAPTLTVAGGFALIARREDARGPVTIYLGSRENLRTAAVGWPARATRGFQVREYARAERPDLADALQAQGIPPSSGVLTAPYVVRIVMWRTPGAADVLPVALSRPPDVALAKGEPDSGWRFLELCPSFRSQPEDIVPPR